MARSEFERKLIHDAMERMETAIEYYHDIDTALVLMRLCKYIAGDDFQVEIEKDEEYPFLDDSIDGYLTVRTCNVLKNRGILTIGELIKKSEDELWRMRYMGKKTFSEIKAFLTEKGLKLKGEK